MSDATIGAGTGEAGLRDYVALLKPRVMSLAVFTALVGMLAAPGQPHPVVALAAILFIALGAGASGALNMWWDADIDALMRRTRSRPVPAGRVRADEALGFGAALAGMSVTMLWLATNLAAAALLAFTIFFYVVIYTMWLKRSTPQNIVIGGAAGAFPPMIGWIAATGDVGLGAVLMFAIIFLWTPPHFWALALFVNADYEEAGVPMLTVTHGPRAARRGILIYSIALVAVSTTAAFSAIGGLACLAISAFFNTLLLKHAVEVWRRGDAECVEDGHRAERSLFKVSIYYLFGHFAAFALESQLVPLGLGGW